ncbi:MAG TPA: SDR family NAD(P)-dependent oxidoreductase [Jiangellales bacterium]|nr:SDR family NAD(P)-dependent oxidoreductase [Jiangellales bacterium]
MTSLDGASVLVTGATGGLGAPLSRRLARAGARLTLVARDPERLAALAADVEGAATVAVDLTDPDAAKQAVSAAVESHGGLDGVVHAAGAVAFGPFDGTGADVLDRLLAVNFLAPVRLLQAALPHLDAAVAAGRQPFVVHLSAVVAEQPMAGMAAYSASKAALTAYDTAVARELRRRKVHLVDARPPHTETGLAGRPIAGQAPPLKPGLDPDAVAERILRGVRDDERDLPASAF